MYYNTDDICWYKEIKYCNYLRAKVFNILNEYLCSLSTIFITYSSTSHSLLHELHREETIKSVWKERVLWNANVIWPVGLLISGKRISVKSLLWDIGKRGKMKLPRLIRRKRYTLAIQIIAAIVWGLVCPPGER